MTDFDAAVIGFAALDEEGLARPWRWRDNVLNVREALYRTLEEAHEASVRVAAAPPPESTRILALAQRAFGDLLGLLTGLPAELLDRAPRDGEWAVRETLHHMLTVERRYAIQTRYAVDRTDAEPIRIADDRLPTAAQMDLGGDIVAILARIGAARAETNRQLADLPPAALSRPSVWVRAAIDVRFRLHRFAVHIVEHTIQCEKALDALGWRQTEGRRIVRRLCAALGELEGLGAFADVRTVEARLVECFASATASVG